MSFRELLFGCKDERLHLVALSCKFGPLYIASLPIWVAGEKRICKISHFDRLLNFGSNPRCPLVFYGDGYFGGMLIMKGLKFSCGKL